MRGKSADSNGQRSQAQRTSTQPRGCGILGGRGLSRRRNRGPRSHRPGDPAMHPDPLDLESPARAPGDPSATLPPPGAGPTEDIPAPRRITEGPGTRIGPYKLLQLMGEGGMGAVYLAEQERPVRRRVALKIIKPGMDTS